MSDEQGDNLSYDVNELLETERVKSAGLEEVARSMEHFYNTFYTNIMKSYRDNLYDYGQLRYLLKEERAKNRRLEDDYSRLRKNLTPFNYDMKDKAAKE